MEEGDDSIFLQGNGGDNVRPKQETQHTYKAANILYSLVSEQQKLCKISHPKNKTPTDAPLDGPQS